MPHRFFHFLTFFPCFVCQPWCRRSQSPTQQPWWIRFQSSTWLHRPRDCNRSWEVKLSVDASVNAVNCLNSFYPDRRTSHWKSTVLCLKAIWNCTHPSDITSVVLHCTQDCILLCWGYWQPTTPTSASWRTGCVKRRWLVHCLCWERWCCPSVPANTHKTSSTRVRRGKRWLHAFNRLKADRIYKNKQEIRRQMCIEASYFHIT